MFPPAQNSITPSATERSTDAIEFVTALARAYTLSEIFPLHHPTVQDAVRDVAEWLAQLEATVVQVSRIGLFTEAEAIPDAHGHVREFARDLSMAGVSEAAFGASLELDQVERFLTALRVVTEEPEVALDEFLLRDGTCDVELAFHGGPRTPVSQPPTDLIEASDLGEADVAIDVEAAVAPIEVSADEIEAAADEIEASADQPSEENRDEAPLELEVSEPLIEWSVEEEIDEDLRIEPLGAFLVEATAQRDSDEAGNEQEVSFEYKEVEQPAAETESGPTTSVALVRVRDPFESELGEAAPPEHAPPKDATGPTDVAARDEVTTLADAASEDVGSWVEPESLAADIIPVEDAVAEPNDWRSEVRSRLLVQSSVPPADLAPIAPKETAEVGAIEDLDGQADLEPESYDDVDLMLPGAVQHWDRELYAVEWGADLDADLDEDQDEDLGDEDAVVEPAVELSSSSKLMAAVADPASEIMELPVEPVFDEAELDASTVESFASVWPTAAYVSAFQAALRDNGSSVSEGSFVGSDIGVAHAATVTETQVDDAEPELVSSFWEDEVESAALVYEDTAADESLLSTEPAFDEPEDGFPGVEEFAPDRPELVLSHSAEVLNGRTEVAYAAIAELGEDHQPEPAAMAEQDLDAQGVVELVAEADPKADAGADAPAPVGREQVAEEGHSSFTVLPADPPAPEPWIPESTASEPDVYAPLATMVQAPAAAPLVHLAKQFVEAHEPAKSALGHTLKVESALLVERRDFEDIATAIDVLVREAVPGDHAAIDLARALSTPPVVRELRARLADVRDADRRDELIYVFGQLSPITAPALSDALSEVPPRTARRNFMDALFRMRSDAIAVAVPMLEDSRWFIVRNGVDVLGEAGDAPCVGKLAPSLAHPDHRVRRATVMALAKLGGDRAGNELLPVLEDPNAEVREAAAMALGHLRVQKALRPMLALLDRDKDDEAQMVILRSLGQIGDPGAVPSIEKRAVGFFFIKPSKSVRIAAYRALANIGTPHARQLVLDAVNDRDAEVAATAHTLAAQL